MKTNEIERFEKLQRELGAPAASLVTMLEKVESYFLSGSKEFRQTRDTFEGVPGIGPTCCGLENRHEENAPARILDDVERNQAEESYCDWLREREQKQNDRNAIADICEGGASELKRMEAE